MTEPEIVTLTEVPTAVVRGSVAADDVPRFFDESFPQLFAATAEQGVVPVGAALALHHGPPGEQVELEVGFPTDRAVSATGVVVPGTLPGGRVARMIHAGGFDGLGAAWERLATWVRARGLEPGPVFWESYLTEPTPGTDPADLRTELNWPLTDG